MTIKNRIPQNRRWKTSNAVETRAVKAAAPDEGRAVVRAIVGALTEVRDGQVLADRHQKSLRCAIGDLRSILNDHNANEAGRSTRHTTQFVQRELAAMRRDAVRPRKPVTGGDLAWDLVRLRHQGR
ncbi:MAG TPA: hypothetical protein VKA66_21455 [Mycobacterium sp.]|nr:hypothetical protein [Mycobacterium sp.]